MAGYQAEYALRNIFRRCVACPDEQPTCPSCPSDQTCIQKPGDGCTTCTEAICVPSSQAGMPQTNSSSSSNKTNVGAIAGGVVGGVAFIAIITFVIWRFCIRPRYDYAEEESSDEYAEFQEREKSPEDFAPTSQARHSTHSVRSASTAMTRASNVIQIAFIPGITDRQGHEDGSSVPPVPPIPSHQRTDTNSSNSPAARHPSTPDHFFTASDLGGGSRWSQFSNTTTSSEDIRSTRHQSLASSLARESVASAIFTDHHATPMSAAQGVRGKANVVSVKPSNTNTPNSASHVPDVPAVDYFKYGDAKKKDGESSTPIVTKPIIHEPPHATDAESTTANTPTDGKDPSDKKPSSKMLAAAIEEATRRASRQPTHGGLGSVTGPKAAGQSSQLAQPGAQLRERDPSPFADSNAVMTP